MYPAFSFLCSLDPQSHGQDVRPRIPLEAYDVSIISKREVHAVQLQAVPLKKDYVMLI